MGLVLPIRATYAFRICLNFPKVPAPNVSTRYVDDETLLLKGEVMV